MLIPLVLWTDNATARKKKRAFRVWLPILISTRRRDTGLVSPLCVTYAVRSDGRRPCYSHLQKGDLNQCLTDANYHHSKAISWRGFGFWRAAAAPVLGNRIAKDRSANRVGGRHVWCVGMAFRSVWMGAKCWCGAYLFALTSTPDDEPRGGVSGYIAVLSFFILYAPLVRALQSFEKRCLVWF